MQLPGRMLAAAIPALLCCMVLFPGDSPAAELKIGYIRLQNIFSKYAPYTEAKKQLDAYEKTEKSKLQTMSDEFQKKMREVESQSLLMTDEILKVKREELDTQKKQLDSYYNDLYKAGGKLETKQNELFNPILDRINAVLMRIGKNDGYDYIYDGEGPILFANPKHDLTDYVLKELEKEAPTQ